MAKSNIEQQRKDCYWIDSFSSLKSALSSAGRRRRRRTHMGDGGSWSTGIVVVGLDGNVEREGEGP